MRILFLTQIIPFPPNSGPRIKTWNVLRYLASLGHQITLISFIRPEELNYIDQLQQLCAEVYTIRIMRSRLSDAGYWLRSNFTGRPFLIERDDLQAMRTLVDKLVMSGTIDYIHADQLTMTQFAFRSVKMNHRPLLVFDAHNATWTIVERMGRTLPNYQSLARPLLNLEAQRVKKYEGMIVRTFDQTLAVTEPDRQFLLQAAAMVISNQASTKPYHTTPAITVIPIAVDTQQLQPISRKQGSTEILTMGTLYYPPNADGVRWFAREVFPLVIKEIPTARLTIVGKNPPQDLLELAKAHPEQITVTGFVPDLKPYLEQAAMVVVPVRAGSGMRVRILEAFAQAMPVVTTTIGLEGIEALNHEEVLIADTPNEFASAVVRLIKDEDLQTRLATNGRQLAVERYDWKVSLKGLEAVYGRI